MLTVLAFRPAAMNRDAAVCRASWKPSGASPAADSVALQVRASQAESLAKACRTPRPTRIHPFHAHDRNPAAGCWASVPVAASAVVAVTRDLRVAAVEVFNGNDSVLDATDAVRRLAQRFTVTEVAFDPWRFKSEALRLEAEGLGPFAEFPQSHARMTVASEGLASVIIERKLRHFGDPDLDRHVAAAVAKPSGRGWRLDKLGRSDQIDACISLAMAVERAQHVPEPLRVLAWIG